MITGIIVSMANSGENLVDLWKDNKEGIEICMKGKEPEDK